MSPMQWMRRAALPLLVALVYLNASTVLVRRYDIPSLLQVAIVLLTIMALAEGRLEGTVNVLLQPLTFLLVSYTAVLLLTTTFARDPRIADQRVLESVKSFGVFLLVVALASNVRRLFVAASTLVVSATFLSLLGIYQTLTGNYARWFGGFARVKNAQIYSDVFQPRIAGPLGDPNFFAQILLLAVPVALFIGWESRGKVRWLAFGCAAIIVAATLLTYSRGGMLALGVILVLALIAHRVDRRRMIGGVAALVVLLLLLPASFTRRFVTIEQILPGGGETIHRDSSFEKRRLLTATAWVTFKNNPLLGVGAGNYTVWFDHYAEQVGSEARGYDDPGEIHYPHNLYLEIAAETGVLGLVIFAAIVAMTLAHLRSANRALADEGLREAAGVAKALELAVIGYLISALFLHGHFQRYLWLMFGLAAAFARVTPLVRSEKTVRIAAAEGL